jgi:hypothetical protein
MPSVVSNAVNCGLSWFIVALALFGYVYTLKKTGERWMFWIILSCGWGLFAVAQTVVLIGGIDNTSFISALWISSFVLDICSLVLVYLKLIRSRRHAEQ